MVRGGVRWRGHGGSGGVWLVRGVFCVLVLYCVLLLRYFPAAPQPEDRPRQAAPPVPNQQTSRNRQDRRTPTPLPVQPPPQLDNQWLKLLDKYEQQGFRDQQDRPEPEGVHSCSCIANLKSVHLTT